MRRNFILFGKAKISHRKNASQHATTVILRARAILAQTILAMPSMAPLVTLRPTVVAWLCVALVMTDASTANPGYTTTRLSAGVGQQGLEVSSENTSNDSFEGVGNGCFEDDDKGGDRRDCGGQGRHDQIAWTSVGDEVDLGELADRVGDALVVTVNVDGELSDPTSSPPGSTPPGFSAHAIGALSNQGEQERGDVQEEGVAEAARRDDAGKEEALEVGVGGVCGEGENQRICSQDEECCNSSCGICAPRGHSCLQIACGVLSRGGGSKVAFCLPKTFASAVLLYLDGTYTRIC